MLDPEQRSARGKAGAAARWSGHVKTGPDRVSTDTRTRHELEPTPEPQDASQAARDSLAERFAAGALSASEYLAELARLDPSRT